MKKLIYLILSVFVSLIFTCRLFVHDEYDPGGISDVVYSQDGKSVTIYFEGGASQPRSLNRSVAMLGHDFFEVTFLYNMDNNPANHQIARASWEVGQKAGISGVFRTPGGVNYRHFNATPPMYEGSAVLFAGKKSDKTLLAVGELCAVDGSPVTSGTAVITSATKSVSFELNALKAGAKAVPSGSAYTAAGSSFLTNSTGAGVSEANTEVRDVGYVARVFPLFRLEKNVTKSAQYTIDVHSAVHPFSYYQPGIILAGGASAANIAPKYTENNKVFQSTNLLHNTDCTVALTNNTGTGGAFQNPVTFSINTIANTSSTDKHVVFALKFEIPVYALSAAAGAVPWVIRPGYDQYNEELDDGKGGNGGAIMIGVGDIEQFLTYGLRIVDFPLTRYNITNGWNFTITTPDIRCEIMTSEGAALQNIPYWDPKLRFFCDLNNNGVIDLPGEEILPDGSFDFSTSGFMDQQVSIVVRYYDNNSSYPPSNGVYFETSYTVIVGILGTVTDEIPPANRFVLSSANDCNSYLNRTYSGIYLWVFTNSFDIPSITLNISGPTTIILTAIKPGIVIGRNGVINFFGTGNTANIYMGTWPLNTPIFIGGTVLVDYPYGFNAGGSYTTFAPPNSPPAYGTPMFNGNGQVTVVMTIQPDITIDNAALLQ